jgi:transposase-like protein
MTGSASPSTPVEAATVAAIIAVGVNSDGRRELLGLDIGPSEAETFWTAFLRKPCRWRSRPLHQ